MRRWTVRVTLLGRHDGRPVPRVGESCEVGVFDALGAAEVARESWLTDRAFQWSAEVVRKLKEPRRGV